MIRLNVSNRGVVLPGQLVGESIYHDINCFREDKGVFSSVYGTVRTRDDRVRIIPLGGIYLPNVDDLVIGVIIDASANGYGVEINSPYIANMPREESSIDQRKREIKSGFNVGDIINAKIIHVNEVNSSILGGPRMLEDGIIIEIDPKRVSRVIGKKKSMLSMIRDKTGCSVIVGQNGRVWIKGKNTGLVMDIIKKIEDEALTQGLTDKISNILSKELDSR